MITIDNLGNLAVVAGSIVFLIAALGLIRFTDPYTRISAVGTAGGIGTALVLIGVALLEPGVSNVIKVVLAIILLLLTSAVGSLALGRSAVITRTPLKRAEYNELDR